jgi:O-antigen ligase
MQTNSLKQAGGSGVSKTLHRQLTVCSPVSFSTRYDLVRAGSLALAAVYLYLRPAGVGGVLLACGALIPVLVGASAATLGECFLIWGPGLAGMAMQAVGLPGVGGVAAVAVGAGLLIAGKGTLAKRGRWKAPGLWLFTIVVTLVVFYFLGPRTAYSSAKLFGFVWRAAAMTWCLSLLAASRKTDQWNIGLFGVVASVAHVSLIALRWPDALTESAFSLGGLRMALQRVDMNIIGAANSVSIMAGVGLALLFGASIDAPLSNVRKSVSIAALGIGGVVLLFSGQRLYVVAAPLSLASMLLCRPKAKVSKTAIVLGSILTIGVVAIAEYRNYNPLVLTATRSGAEMSERVNRSTNWQAAGRRFAEAPVFGHGLGGYYIDGYSSPGSGTYAHNVILELLSETGLAGTLVIVVPITAVCVARRTKIRLFRTALGGSLLPLAVFASIHAMGSHDLRVSCDLFACLAALWAYSSAKGRGLPGARSGRAEPLLTITASTLARGLRAQTGPVVVAVRDAKVKGYPFLA